MDELHMTNADLIRSITDDEKLAKILSDHFRFTDEETPGETWVWLQQEYRNECVQCKHYDAFWLGSGCNLQNNEETCKFEQRCPDVQKAD